MLNRLVRSHCRYFSTIKTAWKDKLAHGPSLKSFIQQTNQQNFPAESTSPSYLTDQLYDDTESVNPWTNSKRRVYFDVYGCQMNENDTDIAYTFLDKHGGYERVMDENDADVVL